MWVITAVQLVTEPIICDVKVCQSSIMWVITAVQLVTDPIICDVKVCQSSIMWVIICDVNCQGMSIINHESHHL